MWHSSSSAHLAGHLKSIISDSVNTRAGPAGRCGRGGRRAALNALSKSLRCADGVGPLVSIFPRRLLWRRFIDVVLHIQIDPWMGVEPNGNLQTRNLSPSPEKIPTKHHHLSTKSPEHILISPGIWVFACHSW